jgi:hypothetical protein
MIMQKMETPILNLRVTILINFEDGIGTWKSLNQAAAVNDNDYELLQ